jgi:hypothetical protein
MEKIALLLLIPFIVSIIFIVRFGFRDNVCTKESFWGGVLQTCNCLGYEYEMYDNLYMDGERGTICIGVIKEVSNPQN